MNPFEEIKKAKQIISDLSYELQYSKDKFKDGKRINDLIDVVNCFDGMLVSKYDTDALDRLIYALIHEWMVMFNVGSGGNIPIHLIKHNITEDLTNHSSCKKLQIIDILNTNTLTNVIAKGELKDWDFVYPNYESMLTDLVEHFKSYIEYEKN